MTDNTTTTAILKLDDVSYAYTKGGKKVLKNISHELQVRCTPSPGHPAPARPRCCR